MGKLFDAALNKLLDERPGEWAGYFGRRVGIPPGPAEVIDTDLATTLQADKVYRINGPQPAILHLEFEGASFLGLPTKLFKYNALLSEHNGPPVHSVLLQLRPSANATDRTGVFERHRADGRRNVLFEYDVIRLWEESFDEMLAAGPSLAPLAILSDEVEGQLEPALARIVQRFRQPDVPPEVASGLAEAVYNLAGLRFDRAVLTDLYRRVQMSEIMQQSSTYQGTLQEGAFAHARATLLRQGRRKFGEPSPLIASVIASVTELSRLDELTDRILDVSTWDELLATP